MTFGEKLSKLRKENNYTQEQLADMLNVSRQSVSKWESNMAYPETDKIISLARLFECSTDYLLKDECISKNEEIDESISESNSVKAKYPVGHQRIIGYILLSISLIAGILIFLLAESEDELYVTFSFVISVLSCSLICLFVKRKAAYWSVWAIVAPIILLSPFLVGLSIFRGASFIRVCFYVVMFFVAKKLFVNIETSISKKKSCLIIIDWLVLIGLRIFSLFVVIDSHIGLLSYIMMDLFIHIGVALLMTYTVCYTKKLNESKSKK